MFIFVRSAEGYDFHVATHVKHQVDIERFFKDLYEDASESDVWSVEIFVLKVSNSLIDTLIDEITDMAFDESDTKSANFVNTVFDVAHDYEDQYADNLIVVSLDDVDQTEFAEAMTDFCDDADMM